MSKKKNTIGQETTFGSLTPGDKCLVELRKNQYEMFIRTDMPRENIDCEFVNMATGQTHIFAYDMICIRLPRSAL